jgi:hypothetical protein
MSAPTGPADARDRLHAPLRRLRDSLRLSSDHLDRDRSWWQSHRFTDEYPDFVQHEARARRIGVCQPLVVPGILQSPEYALAATTAITGRPPDDPATLARVEVRLSRQQNLLDRMSGADPPQLSVVLDEIVLRRPVGGVDVLRGQLDELLIVGALDTVSMTIRPTEDGAHAGLGGYFEILGFRGGEADVVFLEATATDSLLTGNGSTTPYRESLSRLLPGAQDKQATLGTIRQIRDSLRPA